MTPDPDLLSNVRSERVRAVRSLGRRAVRQRQGRFVVEGPQGVRELLRYAPGSARDVYLTPAAADRYAELVSLAGEAGVPVRACTDQVLAAMSDTPHPQGVLAVASPVDVPLGEALAAATDGAGFVVVLTNVRDPGNAGTVIRGADAFGASAVLVSDASVDVYNPKVVRSTVGSLFHLPLVLGVPVPDLLQACRVHGLRLLAADGGGGTMLPDADLTAPHAWVLGNEAWGLPEEVLDQCDDVVAVPIVRAESLNLAMAATVCLHASSAAR
ncbi:TrmH family RNA methyltransferase [Ornithinicoccus hortensis]|uniref:TrmH family RNA methyltransferase n=1 Tax=Ornithinicoccus hortensis TaxID=82346 RepID=A0A542YSF1_9MICO|nr:TrmH family RNA methyltransferase [Ornithinicoccus hortensis]